MTNDLPSYKKPPVVETVCGVLFQELRDLHGVHLGLFWQRLKKQYCKNRELPPLVPVIEQFGDQQPVRLQLTDVPPLPRTWILTESEDAIIQLQRDRFIHNWKKVSPKDEYPRYTRVIRDFREHFSAFRNFVEEQELGSLVPLQYEMTYVNHIPQGDGWTSINDIGNIFPDFARNVSSKRFLPEPDQLNWRTSFCLPDQQGRLHIVIRHIRRAADSQPILLFELTARGFPKDSSSEAMWHWFDLAHVWIVKGFTDLTDADIRKRLWRQES